MKRVLVLALASLGCSEDPSFIARVYDPGRRQIQVEIDYMTGMEPYVDNVGEKPIWEFYRNNVSALLHGAKTLAVPMSLASMQEIPAQKKNYSVEDIYAVSRTYRNEPTDDGTTLSIYIVFLDGYLLEDGVVNNGVIGLSIGNTAVIAVFKPLIQQAQGGDTVRTFIEQSVVIHETGHTLGLVNNGIDLTSEHQDEANGAHCKNSKCVMYYLNEGAKDLLEFTQNGFTIDEVLFGDECLQDASAALGLSS